jgi:hypothetical protein
MSENEGKLFTLPLDYILDMMIETSEEFSGATALMHDMLSDNKELENKYAFSLACEIASCSEKTLRILDEIIENSSFADEDNRDEIIINWKVLEVLRMLVITKHYANIELNKISMSVRIH